MANNPSILTPLQVNAGAGLLQNQGLAINAGLTNAISHYSNVSLINTILTVINTGLSVLTSDTVASLNNLGSNTCPALADSIPKTYTLPLSPEEQVSNAIVGFTSVVIKSSEKILGSGDLSKFCQTLSQVQGYGLQVGTFVDSAINGQTYLGNTFQGMDSMITGSVSSVNLATQEFGQDLANLGQIINTNNLNNLGSPLALVQQIYSVAGIMPALSVAFTLVGISQDVVVNLSDTSMTVSDSDQKLMYAAMTAISGPTLAQILSLLNVKTQGIRTMADLLNPVKLFPNSFQSLTVPTANGIQPIYLTADGLVNTKLATQLPAYVVSSIV